MVHVLHTRQPYTHHPKCEIVIKYTVGDSTVHSKPNTAMPSKKRPRESEEEAVSVEPTAALEDSSSDEESPPAADGRTVYIILDGAQLETVKTKKGEFQLMNCDDHVNIMKRHGKDPQMFRPDIIHQVRSEHSIYWNKSLIFCYCCTGINGCIR